MVQLQTIIKRYLHWALQDVLMEEVHGNRGNELHVIRGWCEERGDGLKLTMIPVSMERGRRVGKQDNPGRGKQGGRLRFYYCSGSHLEN